MGTPRKIYDLDGNNQTFVNSLVAIIQEEYGPLLRINKSANITTITIFTDKERKNEVTKFSEKILSYDGKITPAVKGKSTNPSIPTLNYKTGSRITRIAFKPESSYLGSGKANELAFKTLMETIRADSPMRDSGSFRYILKDILHYSLFLDFDSDTRIFTETKNRKTDIVVGDTHISLKDENAAYVASLNATYAHVAHELIRKLHKKFPDSIKINTTEKKRYVSLNMGTNTTSSSPYKAITVPTDRNFVLFGTGSTDSRFELPEIQKSSTKYADVVLVHDFKNKNDLSSSPAPLYSTKDQKYINSPKFISKIIKTHEHATGKYELFFYLRNAVGKGKALDSDINNYTDLDRWMTNHPKDVPSGLRLFAVFENKLNSGDINFT